MRRTNYEEENSTKTSKKIQTVIGDANQSSLHLKKECQLELRMPTIAKIQKIEKRLREGEEKKSTSRALASRAKNF